MKRALAFATLLLGRDRTEKSENELPLFEPVPRSAKPKDRLIAVRISEKDWEALKELQKLAGVDSMSNLLRLALKSYYFIVHALAEGKKIYICDSDDTPRETTSPSQSKEKVLL